MRDPMSWTRILVGTICFVCMAVGLFSAVYSFVFYYIMYFHRKPKSQINQSLFVIFPNLLFFHPECLTEKGLVARKKTTIGLLVFSLCVTIVICVRLITGVSDLRNL